MSARPDRRRATLFLGAAFVTGFGLRLHLGTVAALSEQISESAGLGPVALGLVSTVTIGAMAVGAPLGPILSARAGPRNTVTLLLVVLAAGGLLRLVPPNATTLYSSSVIVGIAMGAASAVVPSTLVGTWPRKAGLSVSVYVAAMALGVGIAALVVHPMTLATGHWTIAFGAWGFWSLASAGIWFVAVGPTAPHAPARAARRRGLAFDWRVTVLFALPTLTGFSTIAWVSEAYRERGLGAAESASLLLVLQGIQLIAVLALPAVAGRHRFSSSVMSLLVTSLGLALVALAPASWAGLAVAIAGLGIGGSAGLAQLLIGDNSSTPQASAEVGATALTVGFLVGATGPLVLGAFQSVTGGTGAGFLVLAVLCVLGSLAVPRPSRPKALNAAAPQPPHRLKIRQNLRGGLIARAYRRDFGD